MSDSEFYVLKNEKDLRGNEIQSIIQFKLYYTNAVIQVKFRESSVNEKIIIFDVDQQMQKMLLLNEIISDNKAE